MPMSTAVTGKAKISKYQRQNVSLEMISGPFIGENVTQLDEIHSSTVHVSPLSNATVTFDATITATIEIYREPGKVVASTNQADIYETAATVEGVKSIFAIKSTDLRESHPLEIVNPPLVMQEPRQVESIPFESTAIDGVILPTEAEQISQVITYKKE